MALRQITVQRYSPFDSEVGMRVDQWQGKYILYTDHLEILKDNETRTHNHWNKMKDERIQELVDWKVAAIKRYPDLVHLPFPPPTKT